MINFLNIFEYQFMLRALISAVFLGSLLAYLGVFISLKKMSFFGEGIAHSSLFGVALALTIGANPLWISLLTGVLFAIIIYFLEKRGLSGDSAIGVIFPLGLALGAILMNFAKGYKPELMSFLFGNILAVSNKDLFVVIPTSIILLIIIFLLRRGLVLISLDEDLAKTSNVKVHILKPLLYIFTSISVILGIKILGIMLVSAAMVLPISIARLFSNSFKSVSILAVVFSVLLSLVGLLFSYLLDLPTGAVIVVVNVGVLFIASLINYLKLFK